DYMYRVYAQDPQARINLGIRRRLAPLLQNHRRKIELMNGLLLSLPGTPVIYYGDEIGMGDNMYLGDRNGVRTPMQWNGERNAGFSSTNPQRLYLPLVIDPEFHYQMINVETQQGNVHSLLWWMKRLFALRKEHRAFSRGSLEMLTADNPKTLAFIRHWPPQPTVRSGGVGSEEKPASLHAPHGESFPGEEEHILVVANLSRFVQCTRIDMSAYKGMTPLEMMGRTAFPIIGETPYLLTLGPHTFYWFVLKPQPAAPPGTVEPPLLAVTSMDWTGVFRGRPRQALQEALPAYLRSRPS